MNPTKLNMVDILFKVTLSQNSTMRNIKEMINALKRFPNVESVITINGDIESFNEEPKQSEVRKNFEESSIVRQFPSE